MRYLLFVLVLVGCAGDVPTDTNPTNSPPPSSPGTGSSGNSPPTQSTTPDCSTYCSQIATTCTGANAQYASSAACMATCNKFTVGALTDTSGTTLGCRMYHVNNATKTAMPDVHCNHGGPGGGKIAPVAAGATPDTHCSDACTNFCQLSVSICGTGTDTSKQFTDLNSCLTTCAGWDRTAAYAVAPPVAGNNLACRLYHMTAAAADPATHCSHTGPAATTHCLLGGT